eukprot:CAMPEP_0197074158 /NCGR_PEP_ID=MMETSP1384-20130603/210969_1 /TAXON_ID=29189 /ORGANISM="Ammonia sp." /LENGTH=269 /DNA_ID=CAMNT_0042512999 /DNA_START=74 /DNA_END=883 /DNA_ORIENTATION=+
MPICCLCKEDLCNNKFTKSQLRKPALYRKCIECSSNRKSATKQKRHRIDTSAIIREYYADTISSVHPSLPPLVIHTILVYSSHAQQVLHGTYDNLNVSQFKVDWGGRWSPYILQRNWTEGHSLELGANLSFKWKYSESYGQQIFMRGLYKIVNKTQLALNIIKPYVESYGQQIFMRGLYKIVNKTQLALNIIKPYVAAPCRGEIVYHGDSISIHLELPKHVRFQTTSIELKQKESSSQAKPNELPIINVGRGARWIESAKNKPVVLTQI